MNLRAEEIVSWFAEKHPEMQVELITPQTEQSGTIYLASRIKVTGRYLIESNRKKYGYDLSIVLPTIPEDLFFPVVFCVDEKLYPALNRHILSDRQACLGTYLDIKKKCGLGKSFDFKFFMNDVLEPFVAWQLYYDTFGKPAPWGERAHGIDGDFQTITDHLSTVWNISPERVHKMLFGHGPRKSMTKKCFCGSGNTLFFCHGRRIHLLRDKISQIKQMSVESYKIDFGKTMNDLLWLVVEESGGAITYEQNNRVQDIQAAESCDEGCKRGQPPDYKNNAGAD